MTVYSKTELRHQLWRQEVLKLIRSMPEASRISIKRESGLSMESTLAVIDQLLEEELIVSVGKKDSAKAGRKATLLSINAEGCYFIGVRYSAERIIAMCMDFALQPVDSFRIHYDTTPDVDTLVKDICRCIQQLIDVLGPRSERLAGIGLGVPGLIDLQQGRILRYTHIPTLENVPLRDIVQERFGVPTYLEHGVKCSARAFLCMPEHWESHDLLFLQMAMGVNMCAIINGRIHTGFQYMSGEIGQLLCNGKDTVESLVASDSMCRKARKAIEAGDDDFAILKALGVPVTIDAMAKAASRGCMGSRRLLERAGDTVGTLLSYAVMIINPQEIILCGAHNQSSFFEQAVRSALNRRCLPESIACMQLKFAPDDPVLDAHGVALLPYQKQFDSQKDISLSL